MTTSHLSTDQISQLTPLIGPLANMINQGGTITSKDLRILLKGVGKEHSVDAMREIQRWLELLLEVYRSPSQETKLAVIAALKLRGIPEATVIIAVSEMMQPHDAHVFPQNLRVSPDHLEWSHVSPGRGVVGTLEVQGGSGYVRVESDQIEVTPQQFGPTPTSLQVKVRPINEGTVWTALKLISTTGEVCEIPVVAHCKDGFVLPNVLRGRETLPIIWHFLRRRFVPALLAILGIIVLLIGSYGIAQWQHQHNARVAYEAAQTLAAQATESAGPYAGSFEHQAEERAETHRISHLRYASGVSQRDFIAEVQFHNPYNRTEQRWDYGLGFRESLQHAYVLGLDSDRNWFLYLVSRRDGGMYLDAAPVAHGKVAHMDLTPDGTNRLRLVSRGAKAFLFVNGDYVETLDVRAHDFSGGVWVATGILPEHTLAGRVTRYEGFTVATFPSEALLAEGMRLAQQGNIADAQAKYTEAQRIDPTLEIAAFYWNALCWNAGLWKHATDAGVMDACNQAVALAPVNGGYRDSRGLVRALSGDTQGAIADFKDYVKWSKQHDQYEPYGRMREGWIETLKAGENPFDDQTLEQLRNPGQAAGKMVFVSNRNGNKEIYLANADGSFPIQLTYQRKPDQDPALSPDGRRVAFTSFRDGKADIWVMGIDGMNLTKLTYDPADDALPTWSPDGTRIAFSSNRDGNWEIYAVDASGPTNLVRLTNDPSNDTDPAWSPDGNRMAFASNHEGNYDIYLMNLDGTNLLPLTADLHDDKDPTWSPDGGRIAFVSQRGDGGNNIYVMNADGSAQMPLTVGSADNWHPIWLPNGRQIAFQSNRSGNNEIYVMDTNGTLLNNVTNNAANDEFPGWGPISGRIVFVSARDGNNALYAMNPDGSALVRLTDNTGLDNVPDWSPDGTRLAFQAILNGNWEIYGVNADGSALTNLSNSSAEDHDPAWSPDNTRVVFTSNRDGATGIYVMNADGSNVIKLTDQTSDFFPDWSPDGSRIVFASMRDGNEEIYVINLDGSDLVRLTDHPAGDRRPQWSPDGNLIAFQSDRTGDVDIYLMNADGTGQINLTNHPGFDGFPAWSADGTQIAFTTNRNGNDEVYVMYADGSRQTNLSNHPTDDRMPTWSR